MEWLDNKGEAVWRGSRTKRFLFWEKEICPKDGARREGQKEDARHACCIVPVEAGGVGCKSLNHKAFCDSDSCLPAGSLERSP